MNPNLLSNRIRPECALRNGFYLGKVFLAVILILLHAGTFAQSTISVSGIVADTRGESLPGVSVKLKGSTSGVATDLNGRYTLSVPGASAVIVFTYIGFDTREETVGDKTKLNVTLSENSSALDEVVVVGYGQSVAKRDLGGAISSVTAKQIEERQPINIFDALQGQAAGVLIMNDNGEPGAEGSIQIRGASTFSSSGNSPLYVVDGVITDNAAGINPNDIQSIEVLKDAGSSSIYGARAANGVILITTKKGVEGKPRLDVQYSHVLGNMSHTIQQANSEDLRLWRRIQNPASSTAGTATDSLNPAYNSDNYLEDMLLGNTARKNDVRVGVSGGQKGLTYYSSINFLDDKGIALNTWFKRVQGRLNVEYQATPKFKYSSFLTFLWSKKQEWSTGGSLNPVFDRPNNLRIYLPDGSLTSYTSSKRNPIANALLETNETEAYRGQFNNIIDYQIYKDLKFTGIGNAQLDNSQNLYFQPQFLDDNGNENRGKNDLDKSFYWQLQSYLNYSKTLGKDHNISGLAGVSAERRRYDDFYYEALPGSFTSEEIFVFNGNNIDITKSRTTANANSLASIFGNARYAYKGRYSVQGTYRRDGSSRFGPNSKWGNFYSGTATWRFSDESFMSWSKKVLDDAKFRVSIGQQGNDGIGQYEMFTLVNFGTESYNGMGGGSLGTKMGNSSIQWENTVQQNYGLDLNFFNGRLGFTTDYYIKSTNKLLADQQIAKETGFSTVRVNVGDIRNTGMEFLLTGTPIANSRFKWNVSGNITFEQGKVVKLINGQPFVSGSRHLIQEGGRLGDFYGYKQLSIYRWSASNAYDSNWNKLEPVNVAADGKTAEYYTLNGERYTGTVQKLSGPGGFLKGGDAEWENVTKDGIIDEADRRVIGNATPDFYLGLVNNLNFNRFSFSFILNATVGGQIYNAFKENFATFASSNGPAFPEAIYGAWRKEGDIATYPYFPDKDVTGSQKKGFNSYYLEDASFIRLSSARFNYTLAPDLAKKVFSKSINAFVYGVNLLTWTNYTGFDPEFSSSNPLQPGVDGGRYPKRREFGFGLNISL